MISVLFVGDDAVRLQGAAARLQPLYSRWNLQFALGPTQALTQLRQQPVDVLIAESPLHVADGSPLFDRVRQEFPETVRILLAAGAGDSGGAHQRLADTGDAAALERAVECSAGLQARRERPEVRQALALLQRLPPLPRLYWELVRTLDDPDASSGSVAAIIERDVAMTARLLQIANSVFFGASRSVVGVKDAVTLLGLMPIRSLALNLHLFRSMSEHSMPAGFSLQQLQMHSLRSAQLTGQMLTDMEARKTAYSGAMLHDVGVLLLAMGMPDAFHRTRARARSSGEPIYRAEMAELGCHHAQIGGQMLALWGLPMPLVEAVAFHHEPARSGERRFGPATAVHVASVLAHAEYGEPGAPEAMDFEHLSRIGADATVLGWQLGGRIVRL